MIGDNTPATSIDGNERTDATAVNAEPTASPRDPLEVLASVHTANFPELLKHFASSLALGWSG